MKLPFFSSRRLVGGLLAGFSTLLQPVAVADHFTATSPLTIARLDDWGESHDAADINAAVAQVGAFTLPPFSKDAAAVVRLNPGVYSIVLAGADAGTGIALLEIYVLP